MNDSSRATSEMLEGRSERSGEDEAAPESRSMASFEAQRFAGSVGDVIDALDDLHDDVVTISEAIGNEDADDRHRHEGSVFRLSRRVSWIRNDVKRVTGDEHRRRLEQKLLLLESEKEVVFRLIAEGLERVAGALKAGTATPSADVLQELESLSARARRGARFNVDEALDRIDGTATVAGEAAS